MILAYNITSFYNIEGDQNFMLQKFSYLNMKSKENV